MPCTEIGRPGNQRFSFCTQHLWFPFFNSLFFIFKVSKYTVVTSEVCDITSHECVCISSPRLTWGGCQKDQKLMVPFSLYLTRGGGGEGKKIKCCWFFWCVCYCFCSYFWDLKQSLLSCMWESNPCRIRLTDTDPLFCSAVSVNRSKDMATRGRYSCLISSSVFCHLQTALNLLPWWDALKLSQLVIFCQGIPDRGSG